MDWIFIDELDFMDSNCFDVVSSIAIERPEIGITCSSTPSGARSHFYKMCTIKEMGLKTCLWDINIINEYNVA